MTDKRRTKAELIEELAAVRRRVAELEQWETEGRRTEEALREELYFLGQLLDAIPLPIFYKDVQGVYRGCNVAYEKFLGLKKAQIVGKTVHEVAPPDLAEIYRRADAALFRQPGTQVYETSFRHADGSRHDIVFNKAPYVGPDGSVAGLVGVILDITERKRVEEALHRSEEGARRLAREDSVRAEIGRIISSTLNIEEVYRPFSEKVKELIPFDRITINLVNLEERTHTVPYVEGVYVAGRQPGDVVPLAGTTVEKVIQTRKAILLRMENEEEVAREFPGLLPDFRSGMRSGLTVPLISGDRVIGGLALRSKTPGVYTDRELQLADNIGTQIAGAIADAQLFNQQQETEKALRKSEERFRDLYDHAPVGYHEYDAEGRITNINRTGLEMLGYRREEMIGEYVWKFNADPEGVRREILEKLAGIRPPGRSFEQVYRRKDGTIFPVLLENRLARDEQGRVAGIRVTVQDITERKRSEEMIRESEVKFRRVVESAAEGIVVVQGERIVFINPYALGLFGASTEQVAASHYLDFTHPEDRGLILDRYRRRAAGEAVSEHAAYRLVSGQGRILWVEGHATPVDWEGQQATLVFITDITERKRAEEERASLEEQLRQAQKMEAIGTLAGGIAHDFNNILSAVMGYAELASLDIAEGTKARYHVEQSMKAARRARDLVQQILAFSRQGRQQRKLLDITPIVKEGLKFLRASLPTTIEIRPEIEEGLGAIEADSTQVHQVLMNLCTNAAHAMEQKGGVLEVSLSRMDMEGASAASAGIGSGPYVRLRVSDTGHGMPQEILRRIFEPYFTTKEPGKGTGLGLAVVHGIVKSYGGGVTVWSEVGRGSVFDIYLPRIDTVDLSARGYQTESLPLGFRERVLFVDDEEAIVEVGRESLTYLGYEVTARTSSIEALELFREKPDRFDLVITDMTMPNMTGDRLAQELLRIRPGIPIILCTGFSELITEDRAREIGVREFAMKPLVMKDLAKTIRRALGERKRSKGSM